MKIWENSIRSIGYIESNSSHGYQPENAEKLKNMKFLAHLNLSQYSLELRCWTEAEKHARAALSIDAASIKGKYRLIIALMEQDRFEECKEVIDSALVSHPSESCFVALKNKVIRRQREKLVRDKRLWGNHWVSSPKSSINGFLSCCRRRSS